MMMTPEDFERACRRLGTRQPVCTRCGEADATALTGTSPTILCYACDARSRGRPPTEDHHPAGQHNSPVTVPIPCNDHRFASHLQTLWPADTLRNPDHSPLLAIAAAVRGWLDILRLVIERTMGWVPAALEHWDSVLTSAVGPLWWSRVGGTPS